MTPTLQELTEGQRACERRERFQRTSWKGLILFLLLVGGISGWNAFEHAGWKDASIFGVIWLMISVAGILHYRVQTRQAEQDRLYLVELKTRYGEQVELEIRKIPHSLFYRIFQQQSGFFRPRADKVVRRVD